MKAFGSGMEFLSLLYFIFSFLLIALFFACSLCTAAYYFDVSIASLSFNFFCSCSRFVYSIYCLSSVWALEAVLALNFLTLSSLARSRSYAFCSSIIACISAL